MRKQIRWLSFGAEPNLFTRYNPARPFVHWYCNRKVNAFISQKLDTRFEEIQAAKSQDSPKKQITILDLALQAYLQETKDSKSLATSHLEPDFKEICIANMKIFLFGGHDTTSSSLCYTLYLLSKHRKELQRLRAEHDAVLSPDPSAAAALITANPALINKLPVTTAIIRESLRMFPVVTSTRAGEPGYSVRDSRGRQLPTDGFLVWSNVHMIHHDPALWPRAEEFVPERWLVREGDPSGLYPVKGAWRAFEHGPRNCIGQELAVVNMKVFLCLVARNVEVRDCYEELDRAQSGGRKMVEGERAYQVQLSQPEGDFPCRIVKAEA